MYPNDDYYQNIIDAKNSSFSFPCGPEYVVIDLTNKCNCNCFGCWIYSHNIEPTIEEKEIRSQQIPTRSVKRLINSLSRFKTQEVRITGGGEPFLHPDIIPIIRMIKKKGMRCDITTNFTLLTRQKLDALIDAQIDNLTVSLWAGDSETYVKTHPTKSKALFDAMESNLLYFTKKRKGTKVIVAQVLSNLNYDRVEEMLSFGKRTGIDEMYFTLIDPIPGKTDNFLLTKNQQEQLYQTFLSIYERQSEFPFRIDNIDTLIRRISAKETDQGHYDKEVLQTLNCFAGFTFARILANGNVCPCCKSVQIVMGNINTTPFSKIWNSPSYKLFRMKSYHMDPKLVRQVECYKTCDNLMQNTEAYDKVQSLMRNQR